MGDVVGGDGGGALGRGLVIRLRVLPQRDGPVWLRPRTVRRAIGALRTLDGTIPIDTSTKLPDGTQVANVQELQAVMAADARIPSCFARQLTTYALGRTVDRTTRPCSPCKTTS